MAISGLPGRRSRRRLGVIIGAVVVLFLVLRVAARLGVEALWFQELGYFDVLKTRLLTQALLGVAGFVVAFGALAPSLQAALRRSPSFRMSARGDIDLNLLKLERRLPRLALLAAGLVALGFGSSLAGAWLPVQVLAKRVVYGVSEPVFGKDVGFYLFTLPALQAIQKFVLGLAVMTLLASAGVYLLRGGLLDTRGRLQSAALRHLGLLGSICLVLLGVYFLLSQYDVLFSSEGSVFGAGFTDVQARLPGIRVMAAASLAAAGVVLYASRRDRRLWLFGAPVLLLFLLILLTGVIPAAVQKLVVEPNELVRERPYIQNAIQLTREAYDLEHIEERPFQMQPNPDLDLLRSDRPLVDNIRLWDWRPLLATYSQIQEIRLYYNFADVDIDRYTLNGRYRQIMLSAREIAYDQIPQAARTWVNLHLKYTHGYGLCMSPVNRVTSEGLPELFIRDIPPVSVVDVEVRRPEIYYGEQTNTFSLVGTNTDEFDYPVGDTNRSTRYSGRGGIPIGSFGRRLLFSWFLQSRELLLTGYLTPQSRVLMRRSLANRVPRLAPFLHYDEDPYLVVDNGKLVWVWDAYTTSDHFPYSHPIRGTNYIRNAVKVVVDAYDGTTRYYIADPKDPVLRVYRSIFPSLFRPMTEIPEGLRAHLRYPEDLFAIQAEAYATYHMRDPQVFYNREDLWQLPVENRDGREQEVEPYYTILRLPGSDRAEMVLMQPFTPARKDNMIAWIAAACDGADLGKRVVYLFPKQALVYGPRQIEARIDQDPVISEQLTLWNQRGSSVLRGNLLVLPLPHAILYVEPLYLQAEKGALPELKRVILAQSDRIVMAPDLDSSLQALLQGVRAQPAELPPGVASAPATGPATGASSAPASAASPDARRALDILRSAQQALQRGDWVTYGQEMQRLQQSLEAAAGNRPRSVSGSAP